MRLLIAGWLMCSCSAAAEKEPKQGDMYEGIEFVQVHGDRMLIKDVQYAY
jgi:hypothetical protein